MLIFSVPTATYASFGLLASHSGEDESRDTRVCTVQTRATVVHRLPIATVISMDAQLYSESQLHSFPCVGPKIAALGVANLEPRQNSTTHLYLYYAQM